MVPLIIGLAASSLAANGALAQFDDEDADRVATATVLITAVVVRVEDGIPVDEYQRVPLGSGVLVSDDGLIVTNSHVVDLTDLTNEVEAAENESDIPIDLVIEEEFVIYVLDYVADDLVPRFSATVVKERDTLDLAVLKIQGDERGRPLRTAPGLGRPPLPLASPETIQRRDTVQVFGYPVFGTAAFTTIDDIALDIVPGTVRNIEDAPGIGNIGPIQVNAILSRGSSGSPVVNDEGELIGVIAEVREGAGGSVAVAIPVNQVRYFLRSAGWIESTAVPTATATIAPTATPITMLLTPTATSTAPAIPSATPTPPPEPARQAAMTDISSAVSPTPTPAPLTPTPTPAPQTPMPALPTPTPVPAKSKKTSDLCEPKTGVPEGLEFIEDFEESTCLVEQAVDAAQIANGQLTLTVNQGEYKNLIFTRAQTEGRNFSLISDVASYKGSGAITLSVKSVNGDATWWFAVDPSEREWWLVRNKIGTNQLLTWIEPRSFARLVPGDVREVELRVRDEVPRLLVNGVDVVAPLRIEMPRLTENYTVQFGAGVSERQGPSFSVTFERLRLAELP